MVALNHADFLALWETGHRLHPLDRGLLAIQASLNPDSQESPVADWPLGRRNRALAELRTLYFGPRLEGWTVCAECGEKLEFELDCRALAETPEASADQRISVEGSIFRLPTSRDLARIATESDPSQAAMLLLECCAVYPKDTSASVEGKKETAHTTIWSWPPERIDKVAEQMVQADPLAEISLGFDCPLCLHTSEETLDLADFLWAEIEFRARRLLAEVHALASAYGWAESAILALSDVRRANYLQMVQA
jgi:hypothetical protein